MTSITLNTITGLTYPYTIYVCNVYGNDCILISTVTTSVPPINEILLPPPFDMAPAVGIKIITSDGCERFKIIDCNMLSPSFISVWRTTSPFESITLPYELDGTYDGTIDWGDGTFSYNSYSNSTHTYDVSGTYTITIKGIINGWSFMSSPYSPNIIEILQWGCLQLGNSGGNFYNCYDLTLTNVTDTLNLSGIYNLESTFGLCASLTTIPFINNWDVSNVTTMYGTFDGSGFNDDISSWDVSNVTQMVSMFSNSMFNSPIGNWNVSGVTNMSDMFAGTVFDQDINSWDVSNVTEMNQMFQNTVFNQPLSGWNVSNVTTMVAMFLFSLFDQNIGNWNVSMVNDFTSFMEDKTSSTFSSNNLDAIYNGWSSLPSLQTSLNIKFGDAQYTSSSQSGRDILTNSLGSGGYGWIITDGGVI